MSVSARSTAVVLTLAATAAPAVAQPADGLVRIGVTLETTSGVPVLEIECGKFEIRADDRVQSTRECVHGAPVTLALLFDVSASVTYGASLRALVDDVAGRLRDQDRLGVGWFAATTAVPAAFTRDRRQLRVAADAAQKALQEAAGPSPLWEALAATIDAMPAAPGRRAVIVFTDGRVTGSTAPFAIFARRILASGIELHVRGVPLTRASADPDVELRNRPATIALASGGTASSALRSFDLARAELRDIVAGLQRSYLLAFAPDAAGDGIHRLEVRVHLPGIVVRAPDRFVIGVTSAARRLIHR